MKYAELRNFVGGNFVAPAPETSWLDVHDPGSGEVISRVPLSDDDAVDAAVNAARAAFPAWASTPIKDRVQVFYRYRTLLEQRVDELAALVTEENGKIPSEARAEVLKSVELAEFACSLPQIATGEVLEVSRGIECRMDRYPLGVVASIAPFNFPSMVPNWTIPNAIALGNCLVLKPSELVPLSAMRIAEVLREAGLPPGVFQVVHGGRRVAEAICDHPGIAAVTFVGSTAVAKVIYRRATSALKRCLALGGAKNHLIVLPDAEPETSAATIVASMSGCAGQRCMAASVLLALPGTEHIIKSIVERARAMRPGCDIGPVISAAARDRIVRYVDEAEAAGATIRVDGRGARVAGREQGFYVGPTVVDHVRPEMRLAQDEVFGPVLAIIRVPDLAGALAIERASPYGNAVSVFTESGGAARHVAARASAGMVGVNVGVPVPREPFPFGGWNESRFGVGDITGRGSIEFWTQARKVTSLWRSVAEDDASPLTSLPRASRVS